MRFTRRAGLGPRTVSMFRTDFEAEAGQQIELGVWEPEVGLGCRRRVRQGTRATGSPTLQGGIYRLIAS